MGLTQSQGGLINDTYEFCFRTDKRLELDTGLIDAPSKGLVGFSCQAERRKDPRHIINPQTMRPFLISGILLTKIRTRL
jgi:hypothetical protein